MRLLPLFLLFVALELSIVVFDVRNIESNPGITPSEGFYSNYSVNNTLYSTGTQFTTIPGLENTSYSSNYDSRYIWEGFSNWWNGSNVVLIVLMISYAFFLWSSAFFFNRNDTANFAPVYILLLGVGLLPCIHLWTVITREIGGYACSAGTTVCWTSTLIGFILPGILYIFWFFSTLEWWSNRATT